jgi:4-alpha-glucanotransferase
VTFSIWIRGGRVWGVGIGDLRFDVPALLNAVQLPRSSGVLLHLSSLPGGTLGRDAFRFVDWLADAGQSWWALLPIGPPDDTGSPYAAASAFAAWPGYLERPRARVTVDELDELVARQAFWIGDWASYAGRGALADQVRFAREWVALQRYAAERGVRLFGDVPIYVAPGGADLQAHPELFRSGVVAGAPPDDFSSTGQLWGNPLYDWTAVRTAHYRWWIERLRRTFELYDMTRIDHFRGFVAYWAVIKGRKTAKSGRWLPGPGAELFRAAEAELGPLPVVAEDLGVITPPVERLREELGFPGMVVVQFAFAGVPSNPHRLENHREHAVAYTGTHDHDTALGWFRSLPPAPRQATGFTSAEPHWELIEYTLSSRAALSIVQLQDVLGLGSEARLNTPGTRNGNWRWRLAPGQLTKAHARRLRAVTEEHGRT